MQLIANYRIRGVKAVISGKGKGTNVAYPNDVFEPASDESGNRLLAEQNARKVGEAAIKSGLRKAGPDITTVKPEEPGSQTLADIAPVSEGKAAGKTTGKAAGKGGKKTEAKNEDPAPAPAPDAGLDDLGLGDGTSDDE